VPAQDRRIERDPRPLYQRAAEAMLDLINERDLKEGSPFPSETELSRMFDVGRSTVREALTHLESEGFIARRRGVGTVVLSVTSKPALGLETLEPFEELAVRQGWRCGTMDVGVVQTRADALHARKLQIEIGDAVAILRRTKTRNDEPIAVMDSAVPSRFMPADALEREFTDSITSVIAGRFPLTHAVAEVSLVECTADIAERLPIAIGKPLLTLEEIFWAGDVGPLSWNVTYVLPGTMRLELLRERPREFRWKSNGR
jgi:GntR family transcriptional regulator